MADNFSRKFAKALLPHDVDLMRVDAGTRRKVLSVLKSLEKETIKKIAAFGSQQATTVTGANKAAGILAQSVAPTAKKAYKQITDITDDAMVKTGLTQTTIIKNQLDRAITVDLGIKKLSANVLKTLPGKTMIENAPMHEWFIKQNEEWQTRFLHQMREGIVNGESIDQMTRRIRGTKLAGYKNGIMGPMRDRAQTLVRSAVMASANKAREATYMQNKAVIKGMQWLSTLDSRTSDICISLDGESWDMDGNPIGTTKTLYLGPPPAHFNCRSTLLPVTKSFSELSKNPQMKKKLGLIDPRKRKELRASMNGAVSGKLSYEDWLITQPPPFQLEVLGPTKFRLWKAGQLSLRDLIDQSHNPLTVDALLAKHGIPQITVDAALQKAAALQEIAGTKFQSPTQWYKKWADTSVTQDDIIDSFDTATQDALAATANKIKSHSTTASKYQNADGTWKAARVEEVHAKIISDILSPEALAKATPAAGEKPRFVMLGGRGASGKGALTTPKSKGGIGAIDENKFIILDNDAIKAKLPGYEGWNAFLYHEEAAHLLNQIDAIARKNGVNVVWDGTLRSFNTPLSRLSQYKKAGYDTEGYYMFLPPQKAAKRTVSRFKGYKGDYSGRYVPPKVVLSNTANEAVFEKLSKEFKKWEFYDNQGTKPRLIGKGGVSPAQQLKELNADLDKYKQLVAEGKRPPKNVQVTFNTLSKAEQATIKAEIEAKIAAEAAEQATKAAAAKEIEDAKAAYIKALVDDVPPPPAASKIVNALPDAEFAAVSDLIAEGKRAAKKAARAAQADAQALANAKAKATQQTLAFETVDNDTIAILQKGMAPDELNAFITKINKQALDKLAVQQQAAAITEAKAAARKSLLAGEKISDDVNLVLIQLDSDELNAFFDAVEAEKVAALAAAEKVAKEAAEKVAKAKAAQANVQAQEQLDEIAKQKATFEKKALTSAKKKYNASLDSDLQSWADLPATEKLQLVKNEVAVAKAKKKVSDGLVNYKKAVLAGKQPPPAALKAFESLDEAGKAKVVKQIDAAKAKAAPPPVTKLVEDYDNGLINADEFFENYTKNIGTYSDEGMQAFKTLDANMKGSAVKVLIDNAKKTVLDVAEPKHIQEVAATLQKDYYAGKMGQQAYINQAKALLGEQNMPPTFNGLIDKIDAIVASPEEAANVLSGLKGQTVTKRVKLKAPKKEIWQETVQGYVDDFKAGTLSIADFDDMYMAFLKSTDQYSDGALTAFKAFNPNGKHAVIQSVVEEVDKAKPATAAKAAKSAPTNVQIADVQSNAEELMKAFENGQFGFAQFKYKAGQLLGTTFRQADEAEAALLQVVKSKETAADVLAGKRVKVAKAAAPTPVQKQKAQDILDSWYEGDIETVDGLKFSAGKFLNTVPENAADVLKELKAYVASADTVTVTKPAMTVSQIQEQASKYLQDFRFGLYTEKEALEAGAKLLGDFDDIPELLKLTGKDLDDNLDVMMASVKNLAKDADAAKYHIKNAGMEVADEIPKAKIVDEVVDAVEPTPPPEPVTQPAPGVPDPAKMNKVGGQGGSNPGGTYQDPDTGAKWYVKTPANPEIARNEVLAGKLYEKMGIEVPELHLVEHNGETAVASRIIDGLNKNAAALKAGEVSNVAEGFIADAWLANWDVVGLGYDNLLVKAGRAIRVDTGGALRYRAQGGLKGNAFGKKVTELDSMRNAADNGQAASVFGRLTDAQLKEAARKVVNVTRDEIVELVELYGPLEAAARKELVDTLIERQKDIKKRFKIRATRKAPPKPAKAPVDKMDDSYLTDTEFTKVRDARANGYARFSDKDQIEDQQILFWEEVSLNGKAGVPDTLGAHLKARGDLYDAMNLQVKKSAGVAVDETIPKALREARTTVDSAHNSMVEAIKGIATNKVVRDKDLLRVANAEKAFKEMQNALSRAITQKEIVLDQAKEIVDYYDGVLKALRESVKAGEGGEQAWKWTKGMIEKPLVKQAPKAEEAKVVEKKGIEWKRRKGKLKAKKVEKGYMHVTDEDVYFAQHGSNTWVDFYETVLDNGVRVRYWDDQSSIAQAGAMEFIAPKTGAEGARLVQEAMDQLKVNYARPTMADTEERYLRQILDSVGVNPDTVTKAADQASRVNRLKARLAKELDVPDVTKLSGYKPMGTERAFGQGFRYFERPDLVGEFDNLWMKENVFAHSSPDPIAFFKALVDEGGNFGGKFDLFRRGKDFSQFGQSPVADMQRGGGMYAYLRPRAASRSKEAGLYFSGRAAKRVDMRIHDSDPIGRITRNIRTNVKTGQLHKADGVYETIFKNGLSIFDYDFEIRLRSLTAVQDLINWTKKQGGDFAKGLWPDGRKLEQVIKVRD